jgi:hypothetical protein
VRFRLQVGESAHGGHSLRAQRASHVGSLP